MPRKKEVHRDAISSGSKFYRIRVEGRESSGSAAFEGFFNRYGLKILLGIMIILALIIFKDFILLQKFYLFRDIGSDSITINYPGTYHLADYLRTDGIPRWSFKQGLGQNIFPLSLCDPFSDLLFLVGKENVSGSIVYVEILKIFIAGLLFYLVMRKLAVSGIAAVIGALAYAFSGFMILAGAWQAFSAEAVFIAFLLYSFERLFQDNDWRLFPLAVGLITAFQPFDMYTEGTFLLAYAALRIAETDAWRFKKLSPLLLKMVSLGTVGILISSFFSIAAVQQMLESPRAGASSYVNKLAASPVFGFGDAQENMTSILRLFSNDLLGTGANFFGWSNYLEAPLFYCGLINLLLLPQLFSYLSKKGKIIYSILIGAFAASVVFPWFRHAFWLFTGDYYRTFSFFVAALIILYGVKALTGIIRQGRVNLPLLIVSLALLLLALYFPYPFLGEHPSISVDDSLRIILAGSLIGYACLIALLRFPAIKPAVLTLLIAATGAELAYSACQTIDTRPVITRDIVQQREFYNDYTIDATKYLHSIDNTFFRCYKDYSSGNTMHFSINDAKMQDFFGLSSYYPFNQKYYVGFLSELGLIDPSNESQTRWLGAYIVNERMLHSLVGLKYVLSESPNTPWKNFSYDSLATFGTVRVFRNRYCLPLAFTYDSYIPFRDFHPLSRHLKTVVLQQAFVADSSEGSGLDRFQRFRSPDSAAPYPWESYVADLAKLKEDTLTIGLFSQNHIRGTITVAKDKLLFFSIPYDKGWLAKVDGVSAKPWLVNIGFLGIPLDKGSHTVELSYTPPYFYAGLLVTIAGLLLYIVVITAHSKINKKKEPDNIPIGSVDQPV
jgi:uncharacterized membrane protein YfhO